jgi:hypothetical protein
VRSVYSVEIQVRSPVSIERHSFDLRRLATSGALTPKGVVRSGNGFDVVPQVPVEL